MGNGINRPLTLKRVEQSGHKTVIKFNQTRISGNHHNHNLVNTASWQALRYNRWKPVHNDNFFDKTCLTERRHLHPIHATPMGDTR